MKKLKKFSKHILGTMIALCGLLFISHPVYAGTIVLDNANNRIVTAVKDNAPYSHIYSVSYLTGATTSKANLKPIIIDYGIGHYCVLSNVDEGGFLWYKTGGYYGYDITSIDDYLTGSVEVDETKIDDSTPNLLSFYKSNNTGFSGSVSMYDYMLSKGYSAADLDKYLNHYKIVRMTGDSTPASARADGYKVDLNGCIVVTPEKLYSMVKTAVDTGDGSKIFDQEDDTGDNTDYLPMLDYQISKKHAFQLANDFITFNVHVKWDHTKTSPYSEELNRYKVEIRAVQSLSDLNNPEKYKTVITKSTSADATSFGAEDFAEILGYNGDNLQGSKGYLYSFAIRTIDSESNAVSHWKTWTIGASGHGRNPTITPGQNNYDKDGNVVTKDPSKEDDSVDNSGIVKDADGTSNDAKKDPSSDAYQDADGKVSVTGTLSSLKQIIFSLGDVPKLLALCLTWLPDSFSVLISASLAMIVVIGVIRWLK